MLGRRDLVASRGFVLSACAEEVPPTTEGPASGTGRPLTGPVQTILEENRILGGPEDFGLIWTIAVVNDTHLLVGDEQSDHHLMVVDIETGKVVSRFGRHGEGPYEFRQPLRITPDPKRADTTWWVYDFMNWNWTPVTVREQPNHWTVGERYSLAGAPVAPETPMWVGENEAVVHGMFYVLTSFLTPSGTGIQSTPLEGFGPVGGSVRSPDGGDRGRNPTPDLRGGRARPGDRGDRRAQCRSGRESWPAGLPEAPWGEGRRFGVGCGSGGGGETRPHRGTAPKSPGPAHPTVPPSGLLGGGEGRCFQPGGGPERGQG